MQLALIVTDTRFGQFGYGEPTAANLLEATTAARNLSMYDACVYLVRYQGQLEIARYRLESA